MMLSHYLKYFGKKYLMLNNSEITDESFKNITVELFKKILTFAIGLRDTIDSSITMRVLSNMDNSKRANNLKRSKQTLYKLVLSKRTNNLERSKPALLNQDLLNQDLLNLARSKQANYNMDLSTKGGSKLALSKLALSKLALSTKALSKKALSKKGGSKKHHSKTLKKNNLL